MAKLAVIVTVTFFLFAFSHARLPLDLPENEVTVFDPSNTSPEATLPEAETKTTILLPSEKPESEPATVASWEPDPDTKPLESDTNTFETTEEVPESETDTVAAVGLTEPLTVVSFRPVNRHFHHMHGKRPFPLRFPHRCRHHFKQGGPRFNGREIPYGNDMILSGESETIDPMFRGGVRQIPARWARFHHHGKPMFPYRHHEWNGEEDEKRPHHHMEEGEEMEKEHEHKEEVGLMKRFRKFLNHF